ncbi:MAG: SagB/ThcOx family dehydrogenase [Candidatus Latescibacteria bacterium]|nr:SagB/ThcOx family dehydrogenase [Candidatus Latescibacterota bacterium]
MKRLSLLFVSFIVTTCLVFSTVSYAQEFRQIKLPSPQMNGGMPLMQALKERKSLRDFSPKELPAQVLSNMLWAAFGINRPETGKRTAPSSTNSQDIDIYVTTPDGLYLYDAKAHMLKLVVSDDIQSLTGTQGFFKEAPVNLVYVSDFSRLGDRPDEWKYRTARLDTGFISQNVYLFCASERLATVVRGSIDRQTLSKAMKLRPDQKITLAQSVGYSREKKE